MSEKTGGEHGWVVSCEHGGFEIPPEWRRHFAGAEELLRSHRGWDPGTPELAAHLAKMLGVEALVNPVSRLLVETNRSEHHPRLFSEISRRLPAEARQRLVTEIYRPHRQRVAEAVGALLARGATAIHVGVHSFTPVWNGEERSIDVAFLYDPKRSRERRLCARWKRELSRRRPDLRIRRNAPYRGDADGLTTAFRKRFPPRKYLGLELEVSQRWPRGDAGAWRRLRRAVAAALVAASRDVLAD